MLIGAPLHRTLCTLENTGHRRHCAAGGEGGAMCLKISALEKYMAA